MLDPIETWTSRSLQFQPPDTQPSGVSCQPLLVEDDQDGEPDGGGHDPGRGVGAERAPDAAAASARPAASASDAADRRGPSWPPEQDRR